MREARIILPVVGNSGKDLSPDGEIYEEKGVAYDVATDDAAVPTLRAVVRRVGHEAGQLAMYLRHPDGTVEIMDTAEERKVG